MRPRSSAPSHHPHAAAGACRVHRPQHWPGLIFVPVLHWGVAGVAIATAIAYTVSAATLFIRLLKTDSVVRVTPRDLAIDPVALKRIVKIGLPAGIQSAVFAVANIIIQSAINSLGTEVMAASSAP